MYIANRIFENVCTKYTPSSVKRFFFVSVSKVAITKNRVQPFFVSLLLLSSSSPSLSLILLSFSFAGVIFELIGRKKTCLLALF